MRKSTSKTALFKSYGILAVTVAVCIVISKWSWGQYQTNKRAEALYQEATTKQERIKKRHDTLEERDRLLESAVGKEDILIDRFAVKRPGERILILIEDTNQQAVVEQEKTPTWWESVSNWF